MTQTASRNAHAAAVLARLNGPTALDGMATPRRAYEYDDAPTSGGDYVVISLSRMFGGNRRGDTLAPSMWRLTTKAVGSVTNVGVLLDRCTNALEHQSITVGAETSTGIQFETETDAEQDDDTPSIYTAVRSWTYAF